MSILGMRLCLSLIREDTPNLLDLIRERGIRIDMLQPPANLVFERIIAHVRDYGKIPHKDTLLEGIGKEMIPDAPEPADYYAKKVFRRAVINAQRPLVKKQMLELKNFDTADPLKVVEAAKKLITATENEFAMGEGLIVNLKETGEQRFEEYLKLEEFDDGVRGIASPWHLLDHEVLGWKPGDLVTVVARLGIGKTWWALIVADHAHKNGSNIGFVSMEMSPEQIALRRDAIRYGIPFSDLIRGELDHVTRDRYKVSLLDEKTAENDWFLAANGRIQTLADLELFIEQTKVDLVVVDGIYLMGDLRVPLFERVTNTIRATKKLAMRKQVPVICTTQFNRNVKSNNMRGGVENIAFADAIGQDSDVVIGLFQNQDMKRTKEMKHRIMKNRNGRPVEFNSVWDIDLMEFHIPRDGDDEIGSNTDNPPERPTNLFDQEIPF